MRKINQRDLHTELGQMLEEVSDLESIVSLRLDVAQQREDIAKDALEHMESEVKKFGDELEEATNKRAYWEHQLHKVQGRNQPATAETQHVLRTNSGAESYLDFNNSPAEPVNREVSTHRVALSIPSDMDARDFMHLLNLAANRTLGASGNIERLFTVGPRSTWEWDTAGRMVSVPISTDLPLDTVDPHIYTFISMVSHLIEEDPA